MDENKWVSLGFVHATFILGAPFHPIDSLFFGAPIFSSCSLDKKPTLPKGQGTVPNWPASLPQAMRLVFGGIPPSKVNSDLKFSRFSLLCSYWGRISEWREFGQNYSSDIFFDFNSDPKQIGCWKRSVIMSTFFGGVNQPTAFVSDFKTMTWKLTLVVKPPKKNLKKNDT